jgi:topoisomerase-4 subunit A
MSKFSFITEHEESLLELVSTDWRPQVELIFLKEKGKDRQTEIINLEEFITIKGEKALGNKLTSKKIKEINLLDPLPYTEAIAIEEEEVVSEVAKQVFEPELTEEIIEEVSAEIELNITNESFEQIKPEAKDDNETEGQITLEL